MQRLTPEHILSSLQNGVLEPFYLFYGSEEFWIEKTLERIKKDFISGPARDFNVEIFYTNEVSPNEIVNRAKSLPFMSSHRLVIVRDVDSLSKNEFEPFIAYLSNPVDTTTIIWVSKKIELKGDFYKKIGAYGRAVNFKKLSQRETYGWLMRQATELGLKLGQDVPALLYHLIGDNQRDLYNEIFKLSLRYPDSTIEKEQIGEMAIFSRLFTIFDLVDYIFTRDALHSIEALRRLFETQGRDTNTLLGVLGMLARQIRLILRAKVELKKGGGAEGVIKILNNLPRFIVEKYIEQEKIWRENDLSKALSHIYDADALIKSGSRGDIILENLVFLLCYPENL